MSTDASPLARRRAGVLLHITSLPSRFGRGDLGHEAYRFVEWLAQSAISVWQMLPLGPVHEDLSPYNALSVHAGNPQLISLDWLHDRGWLDETQLDAVARRASARDDVLRQAATRFATRLATDAQLAGDVAAFRARAAGWIEDYALFVALREANGNAPWYRWPVSLRDRHPHALAAARARFAERIDAVCFEQYVFDLQLGELRDYAARHGVMLFGDMPIFVAHDSADTWSHREQFRLDADGQPQVVAGVPPDYFSADGQRWGNPHYDWARMRGDGFAWWRARIASERRRFDLVRLDHFRGFAACWEIPRASPTAAGGSWVPAPGAELLSAIAAEAGPDRLVAENLGIITPDVEALRRALHLPGMCVLQFGFDGRADNPHLPHNHEPWSVVYTGTHDNDTSLGWYHGLDAHTRELVDAYFGAGQASAPWRLVQAALASVARLAIVPLQDLLELDSAHRMNTPGSVEGNWQWQFAPHQIHPELASRLHRLVTRYGRA